MYWTDHSSSVVSLAWAKDASKVASAGSDDNIFIRSMTKKKKVAILNAHNGGVTSLQWRDNASWVRAGGDGCVCVHAFKEERP